MPPSSPRNAQGSAGLAAFLAGTDVDAGAAKDSTASPTLRSRNWIACPHAVHSHHGVIAAFRPVASFCQYVTPTRIVGRFLSLEVVYGVNAPVCPAVDTVNPFGCP